MNELDLGPVYTPPAPENKDPNVAGSDVFIAGAYRQNPIVAGVVNARDYVQDALAGDEDLPWEDYNPFWTTKDLAGYPLDLFVNSRSPAQTERIKKQYDRDRYADTVIADSGWAGTVSSIGNGMLNPLYLVPYMGAGRAVGAMKMATEGAIGELATEGIMQYTSKTRTAEESMANVAAGAIFAGILGGIAGRGRLTEEEIIQLKDKIKKDVEFVGPRQPERREGPVESLADIADVDQITGVKSWAAKLSPIRILASKSPAARKLGALLGEQNVVGTTKAAVETRIKRYDRFMANALNELNGSYKLYSHSNAPKMTRMQFNEQVVYALRNGDEHLDPIIQQAAQKIRREVLTPVRKEAEAAGIYKSEADMVKYAKSYFPRQYDYSKIEANRHEFIQDIKRWIQDENPNVDMLPEDLASMAIEVARKLVDDPMLHMKHRDIKISAGALKGRKLAIPDNVLSKWLINEPDVVIRSWVRDIATETEFTKMFGDTSLKKHLDEVAEDWDKIIREASSESEEKALKLANQRDHDLEVLRALRDRLQHKYKLPDNPRSGWVRAGRAARNLNIARLLGGMTVSAMPDLARPLYHHHMMQYGAAIANIVGDKAFRRMAKADMERMGVALDLTLNSRLRAIAEADYLPQRFSKVEAVLDDLVTGSGGKYPDFGRISLMSHWNANLKLITGVLAQDGLIRAVNKNNINMKELGKAGIDKDMARRIKAMVEKHGSVEKSTRFGNSDKWEDVGAAEAFENAVLKEVDATIVTPGVMDKPLWMSSEIGKVLGQLKSFGFAATNKQMLAGLNNFTGRFVIGSLAAVTLGAMTYSIKRMMSGNDPDDNVADLVGHGIDYSGVIGMGSDAIQFGGGVLEAAGLYKGDGNFRWAKQDVTGQILGPTGGLMEDALRGARALTREQPNAGDVEALRRLMPYNNLFYTRMLFDEAEQHTKDRLGIPD